MPWPKNVSQSPELIAKRVAARKPHRHTEASKALMRAKALGRKTPLGIRRKMSLQAMMDDRQASLRKAAEDPEWRARHAKASSDRLKARHAAARAAKAQELQSQCPATVRLCRPGELPSRPAPSVAHPWRRWS